MEKDFIKLPQVINLAILKKSSIYTKIQYNLFPASVELSSGLVVWDKNIVLLWMEFKAEVSKNNIKFNSKEEEATAWKQYREAFEERQKETELWMQFKAQIVKNNIKFRSDEDEENNWKKYKEKFSIQHSSNIVEGKKHEQENQSSRS